jgi:hypothetical protein
MTPTKLIDSVAAAEQEARDAAALATRLKEAVINGDRNVTPEQIDAQQSAARFAELRAEHTRRQVVEAARKVRSNSLKKLHDEIQVAHSNDGEALSSLLQAIEDSIESYVEATESRHERLHEWLRKLHALEVTELDASESNARAEDEGVGIKENHVTFENAYLSPIAPLEYVGRVLGRVQLRHPNFPYGFEIHANTVRTETVYDDIARDAGLISWGVAD